MSRPASPTAHPAERILLGPGPSPVPQRVLHALGAPTLGHLDPQYLAIMDETCAMLREDSSARAQAHNTTMARILQSLRVQLVGFDGVEAV